MKILKIILIGIGSFVLAYCLTAFCHADFNFKNWQAGDRFFTEFMAMAIWGGITICFKLKKD